MMDVRGIAVGGGAGLVPVGCEQKTRKTKARK